LSNLYNHKIYLRNHYQQLFHILLKHLQIIPYPYKFQPLHNINLNIAQHRKIQGKQNVANKNHSDTNINH